MADNTKIEWADATLNYVNGCTRVSPGCVNCYAERLAATRLRSVPSRAGLAEMTPGGPRWTGKINIDDRALDQALRWRRPRRIFWNAHGDLFHESVPDEAIDRLFAVCALTPHHTHMILTKRAGRMREYMAGYPQERIDCDMGMFISERVDPLNRRSDDLRAIAPDLDETWPLPNVWLGVSVEDQQRADERIPDLLATPAAVRFISAEPLLGPVDIERWMNIMWQCGYCRQYFAGRHERHCTGCGKEGGWCGSHKFNARNRPERRGVPHQSGSGIDWVIAGGESGPGARPMHPDWARSLRDQCAGAGVPFLFKQWGEWVPQVGAVDGWSLGDNSEISRFDYRDWEGDHWGAPYGVDWTVEVDDDTVSRIGKQRAGRLLDGVEHNEFPEAKE